MDKAMIAQVRRFNRVVTQHVGALNERYLARDHSLGEARVLWEIGAEGCDVRTLRTRLNHMKTLQPIHSVVVTSPSPAEGKSLSAANLALAEAHLAGNVTLLADFDFRRPIVHSLFQVDRSPGITDYLQGKCQLHEAMRRIAMAFRYLTRPV